MTAARAAVPSVPPAPSVSTLRPEHAGEALTVQYAAYLSEGRRYATTEIPPLVEDVAALAADLQRPDTAGFGAWMGPRLVGSVRLRRTDEPLVELTRFSVAPDVQGHGVGGALLAAAHAVLRPGVRTWLVTGTRSVENHGMYTARGYREVGRTVDGAGVELVRMERLAP